MALVSDPLGPEGDTEGVLVGLGLLELQLKAGEEVEPLGVFRLKRLAENIRIGDADGQVPSPMEAVDGMQARVRGEQDGEDECRAWEAGTTKRRLSRFVPVIASSAI